MTLYAGIEKSSRPMRVKAKPIAANQIQKSRHQTEYDERAAGHEEDG